MGAMYENKKEDFHCRNELNGHYPLAFGAHLHYHLELVYMVEGCTTCAVDTGEYTLQSGDVLLVFPNQVHRYDPAERERYLLFIINPDMMPELSSVFSRRTPKSPLIKGATDDEALISLLHLLANTDAPSPYRDVTRKGLLSAFFGRLLDKIELIEPRTEDSHAIRDVVNFCSEHFTSDLSLEMLEENLHLSRYYISHLFSHKLNIRFNDYVNSLRVSEACRLLRATTMGITDISAQVGFNTLRTFNRSFVKQMGQSPSEYRRRLAATAG
jgi:AraC-like DNA-binding protein